MCRLQKSKPSLLRIPSSNHDAGGPAPSAACRVHMHVLWIPRGRAPSHFCLHHFTCSSTTSSPWAHLSLRGECLGVTTQHAAGPGTVSPHTLCGGQQAFVGNNQSREWAHTLGGLGGGTLPPPLCPHRTSTGAVTSGGLQAGSWGAEPSAYRSRLGKSAGPHLGMVGLMRNCRASAQRKKPLVLGEAEWNVIPPPSLGEMGTLVPADSLSRTPESPLDKPACCTTIIPIAEIS